MLNGGKMQNTKIRVLMCDDDPADRSLVRQLLKLSPKFEAELIEVEDGAELAEKLDTEEVDVILLDIQLPGKSGLEWLREVKAAEKAPVIMATGHGDEMVAVEAMKAGASDYLPKSQFSASSLTRSISNVIEKWELENTVKKFRKELVVMATTDELTGLLNRRSLMDAIKQQFGSAQKDGRPFVLVMLDIDHFKRVNDTYGHDVGDLVLVGVCRTVEKAVRPGDSFGRYGGEEFIIVLKSGAVEDAVAVAEQCRRLVEEAVFAGRDGTGIKVTVSLGVAACSGDAVSYEEAIKRADTMLYKAKESGRNRVETWDCAVLAKAS